MLQNNVETGRWFDSPVSAENIQKNYAYTPGTCPIGERIANSISNLPSHANMSDSDVKDSANAMADYFASNEGESEYMSELISGVPTKPEA